MKTNLKPTTNPDFLIAWLNTLSNPTKMSACLEQTGHYGFQISKALHQLNIHSLFLVNPRQIKAFGQQKLRRNKSDTADAKLIARFVQSEHMELRPWQPRSIENERITELSRYAESIVRELAKLKTKYEAASEPSLSNGASKQQKKKSQTFVIVSTKSSIQKKFSKQITSSFPPSLELVKSPAKS